MGKKQDSIIRVGDVVRVIDPHFFVRCGYDNNFQKHYEEIMATQIPLITSLIVTDQGINKPQEWVRERVVERIAKALAYNRLMASHFRGGAKRQIYTERRDRMMGEVHTVGAVKFVKTGVYEAGYRWDDDAPPQLLHEKTHKIIELSCWGLNSMQDWWIEAANVKKLTPFVSETAIMAGRTK